MIFPSLKGTGFIVPAVEHLARTDKPSLIDGL